jgi:hypothetical protein
MKVLFDNGTPKPIARYLPGHEITYTRRIGWHELENGELIQQAEAAGYEVLLSTDKNIRISKTFLAGKSRSWFSASRNGRLFVYISTGSPTP